MFCTRNSVTLLLFFDFILLKKNTVDYKDSKKKIRSGYNDSLSSTFKR